MTYFRVFYKVEINLQRRTSRLNLPVEWHCMKWTNSVKRNDWLQSLNTARLGNELRRIKTPVKSWPVNYDLLPITPHSIPNDRKPPIPITIDRDDDGETPAPAPQSNTKQWRRCSPWCILTGLRTASRCIAIHRTSGNQLQNGRFQRDSDVIRLTALISLAPMHDVTLGAPAGLGLQPGPLKCNHHDVEMMEWWVRTMAVASSCCNRSQWSICRQESSIMRSAVSSMHGKIGDQFVQRQ